MKRSPAFAQLSRDHHDALVIAMALTRAGAGTAHSATMLFADFISEHEVHHFALEEAYLLPALPPGQRGRELSQQVLADHRWLRESAEQVRRAGARSGELAGARSGVERAGAGVDLVADAQASVELAGAQSGIELAHSLGARLRAHVQLEERKLFPYLEESLDPATLAQIGVQIDAAAEATGSAHNGVRDAHNGGRDTHVA